MRRAIFTLLLTLTSIMFLAGCSDDDPVFPDPPQPPPPVPLAWDMANWDEVVWQ